MYDLEVDAEFEYELSRLTAEDVPPRTPAAYAAVGSVVAYRGEIWVVRGGDEMHCLRTGDIHESDEWTYVHVVPTRVEIWRALFPRMTGTAYPEIAHVGDLRPEVPKWDLESLSLAASGLATKFECLSMLVNATCCGYMRRSRFWSDDDAIRIIDQVIVAAAAERNTTLAARLVDRFQQMVYHDALDAEMEPPEVGDIWLTVDALAQFERVHGQIESLAEDAGVRLRIYADDHADLQPAQWDHQHNAFVEELAERATASDAER